METATDPARRQAGALLEELLLHRRATHHFTSEAVPRAVIDTALTLAAQAPSGFNFQPWRFLVVTDAAQRLRLQRAAFGHASIAEAPVVIVAFAEKVGWKSKAEEILRTRAERTGQTDFTALLEEKRRAFEFIDELSPTVWLNRQVMVAFTCLMLAVESLGWNTEPIEEFNAAAVRAVLELPADAEVVAFLLVGRAADPAPVHPGRLPVSDIAHDERFGAAFVPFNQSES